MSIPEMMLEPPFLYLKVLKCCETKLSNKFFNDLDLSEISSSVYDDIGDKKEIFKLTSD